MSYYLLLVELPKPSFHPFIHEQAVILTWMTGKIVFMCLFSSLPRQERYLQKEGKEQKLVTARQISCNAWLGYLLFPLTKPKPLQDWKLFSKMPQLRNKSRAKKPKLSSIFVVESWCSRQGVLYLDVFEVGSTEFRVWTNDFELREVLCHGTHQTEFVAIHTITCFLAHLK